MVNSFDTSHCMYEKATQNLQSLNPENLSWRTCSQEALANSLPMLSVKEEARSEEVQPTHTKTTVAAQLVLPVSPASALVRDSFTIKMNERFAIIESIEATPKLSFGEYVLRFPQATEFYAVQRNRYPDVLPTSLDLVTLKHPTTSETSYINASRFENTIITQGPLINEQKQIDTVADLWVLAFEEGNDVICLTDHLGKKGKFEWMEKTFPYWDPKLAGRMPDHNQPDLVYKKNVGPTGQEVALEVRLVEGPGVALVPNKAGEFVTKRIFEITFGDQKKRIAHWHYEHWKDHSVCDPNLLAEFIKLLLTNPGVKIEHCSAGIGRGGVFAIALLFIEHYVRTKQIPTDQEIDKAVIDLRRRRPASIQSPEQLALIGQTVEAFIKKTTLSKPE